MLPPSHRTAWTEQKGTMDQASRSLHHQLSLAEWSRRLRFPLRSYPHHPEDSSARLKFTFGVEEQDSLRVSGPQIDIRQ